MKRIINAIGLFILNILKAIYSVFDKILITPLAKIFVRYTDSKKGKNGLFDRLINNKQFLIVFSLAIALIVFFLVDRETVSLLDNSAEVLYGQKVKAIYNEASYVVDGLPETVDITLIGRKSDVYLAKQYPTQEVSVDLSDLGPGSHTVKLKYSQDVPSVDYKLDPSTASIVIYEKQSKKMNLSYDVLHEESLNDKLQITDVDLSSSNVVIKSAEYRLEQVASIKALVDVNNMKSPTAGEMTLENVPLVAYDSEGKVVDVEIVPKKVNAKVKIESPSKSVPIKYIPDGTLAFGKGIENISSDTNTVVVYGSQKALEKIDSIPVKLDVKGLAVNKEYNVTIDKPKGAKTLSITKAKVKVTVGDLSDSITFNDIYIETKNLASGLKVQASSKEDSQVSVVVSGTKSVLKDMESSSVNAYIDLDGLGVGTHEVEVKVTGTDVRATYEPKVTKVKVNILKK